MSDQDNLRDRIARVHFAKTAELAARQFGLDKPVRWEQLTDQDREQLLDSAQAIIDEFGMTMETGQFGVTMKRIVGKWEKQ